MSDASRSVSSLTVLGGALNGKSLALDPALPEILIGSAPACHLQLNLPGVSPLHARVTVDASGAQVRDAGGPRGIFVNDDRVTASRTLRDGDVLWLGPPGDGASVMVQCRIVAPSNAQTAPTVAAPPPAPRAPVEFFVEEGPALADGFVVADDNPFPGQEATAAVAVPPPPAAEEPEVFFVDELPPPVATAPTAAVPVPTLVEDEGFFVADSESLVIPPPAPAPQPAPPKAAPAAPKPQPPAVPAPPKPVAAAAPTSVAAPAPKAAPPAVPPASAAPPPAAPLKPSPAPPAPAKPATAPAPAVAAKPATPPPEPPRPAPAAPKPPAPAQAAPRPTPPAAQRPARRLEPPPEPRARAAPRQRGGGSRLPLYGGVAAIAVAAIAAAGYLTQRARARPELESISPTRAKIGELLTLTGRNFGATAAANAVIFGETRADVREASTTRLVAEVPEVPVPVGPDITVPVVVRVDGHDSPSLPLAIHQAPRIHGLSPDVAMPGEEVTLAGSGWAPEAVVRFGPLAAEVLENKPTAIRVRVPAIEGPPGTAAPVTVSAGLDASNPAPFLVGRLPLITGVQPASAAPGDVVSLSGRGFHWKPAENVVRVRGARAFVSTVAPGELKLVVPWVSGNGVDVPIELRVPDSENRGQATLSVTASPDPVEFRFVVEPLEAVAASPHAVLSTALGPAFVLATSGTRSAADRATEAVRRLSDAAVLLKASHDLNFEVRNVETAPILGLVGRPETILEVTDADAAAYNEDWTKAGGRGGPVTRARLALWWQAVARDLVLLLVRGEKPQYAPGLAPEGRVLGEVFDLAKKSGRFGVPRDVAAALRPPVVAALRTLALRVPAQVVAPAGTAPAPTAAAASAAPTAASPPAPATPFRLDGVWTGTVLEGGTRRYVTATFSGRSGSLSFEGAVSVSVPLFGLEPQRDGVRFGLEYRGGNRYYSGKWDGHKIAGRISSDAAGRVDVGAFELSQH